MKSMTCNQLGGACDKVFRVETFEEIIQLSKAHGTEMYQKKDEPHLKAMEEMRALMQSPDAMQKWFLDKKAMFESLPHE